jgi:hypothetical protein
MLSIPTLALCLFTSATGPENKELPLPKGIWGMPAVVVAVHKDSLDVTLNTELGGVDRKLRIKVTEKTQVEQADLGMVKGKADLKTKAIAVKDLRPDQPISVIVYSDGMKVTLLRAMATGSNLGGPSVAAEIKKLGGKIERLKWLKDKIAFKVDLQGTKTTDADLMRISKMKGISLLDLSFTQVTDKGITALVNNRNLVELSLAGTKVTDKAIEYLRQVHDLNTINLAQTAVTDKGISLLVNENPRITVCKAGLGNKAQFRVLQQYSEGKLNYNYLMIGDTYYGNYLSGKLSWPPGEKAQDRRRQATTYYNRHGPVGQVMSKFDWFKPAEVLDHDPSDARLPASLVASLSMSTSLPTEALAGLWSEPAIGVIRLNVGTHAAYGRPFQTLHFYNSTKELATFCLPPKGQPVYFGFIRDALKRGCNIKVFEGDERAVLGKKGPKQFYSALFIDITRNDLRDINTNLFTKEAMAEMMAALT